MGGAGGEVGRGGEGEEIDLPNIPEQPENPDLEQEDLPMNAGGLLTHTLSSYLPTISGKHEERESCCVPTLYLIPFLGM